MFRHEVYNSNISQSVDLGINGPPVHRLHTAILNIADKRVGSEGVRRFPGGNILVTSFAVQKEILAKDETHLQKDTAVNIAAASVVGNESIFGHMSGVHPEETHEIRGHMTSTLHEHRHQYVSGIREAAENLCKLIETQGGEIDNLYEHVHGVFIEGLLRVFGINKVIDRAALQREVVGLSRDMGVKTLLGNRLGELLLTYLVGQKESRTAELTQYVDEIISTNNGLWNLSEEGALSEESMRANLLTLLGAGTTSPAAAVCWSLYDAAYDSKNRSIIVEHNDKRALADLMARTLSKHPFGFVINRRVIEPFNVRGVDLKTNDTVWLLTVPDKNRSIDMNETFALTFGSGARNCLGKSFAIISFQEFLFTWGKHFQDWEVIQKPNAPIYFPSLKPKGMAIKTIQRNYYTSNEVD